MIAFDIHFTSKLTGEEVEPNKSVDVKIEITDAELAGVPEDALGTVTITHIFDEGGAEILSQPQNEEVEEISEGEDPSSVDKFSTFTISWYYGYRSVTVHHGYMNGNTFVEMPEQPSPALDANKYYHLIYDFDGYQFDSVYRSTSSTTNPTSATRISPLLQTSGNSLQYRTLSASGSNINLGRWSDLRNSGDHIYVIYKAKVETTGGTPSASTDDETWPEGDDAPQFSKSSTHNGDGTNTIALSITAAEKPVEQATPADVIVVFDKSGSMRENMAGTYKYTAGQAQNMNHNSRMWLAADAVNKLANTLLNGLNRDIRMALISYSDTATVEQSFTNNYSTFTGKVNTLEPGGGTNWEDALVLANSLEVRSNAACFVIFVSDGDPTVRISRGNVTDSQLNPYNDVDHANSEYSDVDDHDAYYPKYGIYGNGYESGAGGLNFDFAVNAVSDIVSHNKTFYAIGVSNDVTKMEDLASEAGVSTDNVFLASNSDKLKEAFEEIASSIKSALGFGDIQMNDGITELTNSEMKVMQTVDPNSFSYYRYGGEGNKYGVDEAHKTPWTTREADGCAPASYNSSTGAVQWNMGSGFQLESGVTYIVTFNVWGSQEAYDLITELNNGIKVYAEGHENSITQEQRDQIIEVKAPENGQKGEYTLNTNTNEVSATYKKTTKTGDSVTVSDTTPVTATYHAGKIEPIELDSMQMHIVKEFEDDLTSGEDREKFVTLTLLRRVGTEADKENTTAFEPYAFPHTNRMPIFDEEGNYTGEYTEQQVNSSSFILSEANDWSIDLYVAPGLKSSGQVREHGYDFKLSEPDIDYHYGLVEEIINPMMVDEVPTLIGDGDLNTALTGLNRVKSGIDVKKVVVDADGNEISPDTEFTIKGKLLDEDGNPFTWSEGDDVNASGAYHKYDAEGNRIVYKGHFASTDNIEFTLKAGEYVRFINVPDGCTFEFDEEMPANYEWVKSEGATQHRTAPGSDFTPEGDVQPVISGQKVSLATGVVGNKQYSVTFTNRPTPYFYIYHSSVAGDGDLEKISMNDVNANGEYNLYDHAKQGTLYGGYYLDYAGKGDYKDDGVKGTTGVKYTGMNVEWSTPAQTVDGTKMKPEAGETYYIKEVPVYYLRNYHQINYVKSSKKLVALYLISAIDDLHYQESGLFLQADDQKTSKVTSAMTYRNTATGKSVTLKANTVFKSLGITGDGSEHNYLTFWEATDSEYFKEGTFTVLPYWITPDGITVTGASTRTITISSMTKSGITKTDSAVPETH